MVNFLSLLGIPVINAPLNTYVNNPSNRFPIANVPSAEEWSRTNLYSPPMIESHEELKSPSSDSQTTETPSQIASNEKSPINENDMKTEFVNFRRKQFETGTVENIVHDSQRDSKTKKYSEKKKYETEWNRLTAVADVESVMERASHFEDIDPDKFARLKSKLPTSPPAHDNLNLQENFTYDTNQNQFYDSQPQFKILKPTTRQSSMDLSSSLPIPRVGELNSIEFNFDPRYMIQQVRTNPSQSTPSSHYNPLASTDSSRYLLENYSNNSASRNGVNLIRQQSYISAVRSNNQSEQPDFVTQFGSPPTSEQDMKQRQPSYLMNNDQRLPTNRGGYIPTNFNTQSLARPANTYDMLQEQKLRSSSHHQTQAIKKLKHFFGENTHENDHRPSLSQSPLSPQSSSGGRSKSGSFFDGSTLDGTTSNTRESIPLTTLTDNLEASKEGILYCKTVLKEGRRAADRSWRGAWAVLRRGALFLGKEKKHGLLIPLSCDSFPINLENADVELASDYIKKPRVFKLTTSNQSEFLFQAPDIQSLNEWLDVINENCLQSESGQDNQQNTTNIKENNQRINTRSLPPIPPNHHHEHENVEQRKSSSKSKISLRSPSLKRSPSLRFRKSQKSAITQPAQSISSISGTNSPPNDVNVTSPRRSFVKSIVKKGLRTLKSSSSLLTSQMSGQIYDESSGESLTSSTGVGTLSQGVNFGIELEECETSSISRYIPIVVEILTRLVELRGINYQEKKHGLLIPLSCDSFPINLENADVELASDYIKKPRVFKLTTSNQSEFLFQAPDIQSLNEWLDVINENCLQSESGQDNQQNTTNIKENNQRINTRSLPPIPPNHHHEHENVEQRKSSSKSKISLRSPSLKRSPSLRFRKSQKSAITQPAQSISSISGTNSPPNDVNVTSPRRSFVKSIVKKGLRTLKSSSSLLTSQMSGQIYDESSGESLTSSTGVGTLSQGVNFGIELEECETSSISRYIPIVVEILTRLVELRGINYQGIYRHAGGLTAVNWLVNELDKGAEKIDFNSEKWYDVKAVASTLKTFFAKLPDSLLSSKMSSLCVESSRIENHCDRLVELKRLLVQLDDYRFETLKYLCAHFRRVSSKCEINKIDARNLAIIFGPTLIWDSKASLQSNLVDNPEKIRIVESFILYYEWFFDNNSYDSIPVEINPQMPRLPPVISHGPVDPETLITNETKPSEIIQHIVRAAKRRWSSPILLENLSSLNSSTTNTTNDQQTSKPINISVKRNRRREKFDRCYSFDLLSSTNQENDEMISSKSTDSALYSMSDKSCRIFKHLFNSFLSSSKSKILIPNNLSTPCLLNNENEKIFFEKTSLLKSKLIQREQILENYQQQIHHVDQQLVLFKKSLKEDYSFSCSSSLHSLPPCYSSLYALELL
ncbi:unnamed protein product [Adineta steineri]|uniref:Uncharacterized protein n=2 Tax=Adineta steineri TaxID=433720 RepID=A0A815IIV9_9BILA|nr:unnamed protein product [Adineta steineri]